MFLIHLLTASGHIGSPVVLDDTEGLTDWLVFLRSLVLTAVATVGNLAHNVSVKKIVIFTTNIILSLRSFLTLPHLLHD